MDKQLQENMPIYMQIMQKVREAIASGELAPGARVASVRELAGAFAVNPNTMQRALNELEREGLLISERTSGRFVAKDTTQIDAMRRQLAEEAAARFRREMQTLGFSEAEMLAFFRVSADDAVLGAYGTPRGRSGVRQRAVRMRYAVHIDCAVRSAAPSRA